MRNFITMLALMLSMLFTVPAMAQSTWSPDTSYYAFNYHFDITEADAPFKVLDGTGWARVTGDENHSMTYANFGLTGLPFTPDLPLGMAGYIASPNTPNAFGLILIGTNVSVGYGTGQVQFDYDKVSFGLVLSVAGPVIVPATIYYTYGGKVYSGIDLTSNPGNAGGVPEPATWGMLIGGFAMAGGMIRRRRSVKTTDLAIAQ